MNDQLVVNWHILEKCNYSCGFCFAHWPSANNLEDIYHYPSRRRAMLSELRKLPQYLPDEWGRVRLNIAGGEPMLLWRKGKGVLHKILTDAESLDFDLSIISNGYYITDKFIEAWVPKMQILGISVDSFSPETNAKIGRTAKSGKQISAGRIAEIFKLARKYNPVVKCKLNTVVNSFNWQENLHTLIDTVQPDRWKVFKMLPTADTPKTSKAQARFKISDAKYDDFLQRHRDFESIMAPENNDAMVQSYFMVDPLGRFYQNEPDGLNYRHVVSKPIPEVGVAEAFKQIRVSVEKFKRRYPPNTP